MSPAPLGRDKTVKTAAATLSILSNTALVVLKLVVAGVTGSVSVFSEAIHSGVDLAASVIAFFAVRASDAPADSEHPYGHGKYENVSGAAEGVLILAAAWMIGYEAVHRLAHHGPPVRLGLALAVMAGSGLLNWAVSWRLLTVAKLKQSDALLADAMHLRTDVFTSLGVFIGLLLTHLTGWAFLDPAAALVVTAFIVWVGWKTLRNSIQQLIDVSLPVRETERIAELARLHPGIRAHHRLRARRVGGQRQIDFSIQVPWQMTVREGHSVAHDLQEQIEREMGDVDVVIHVEPWEDHAPVDAPSREPS